MASRRVLCKFFVRGACRKGENCEFSHDWKDMPNNICIFYQKGMCSYGSQCRYHHIKVSQHQTCNSSSSNSRPFVASSAVQVNESALGSSSGLSQPAISVVNPESTQNCEAYALPDSEVGPLPTSIRLSDQSICSFAASGSCPHGEKCTCIHGDLCSICGMHCLHPYRLDEREEHLKQCQKNSKRLQALKLSQEIECCVCLDLVLSKPTDAERKFGLLSECDHPFCISCIRNWRNSSPASGMDVNTALRACPVCRKLSYFVTPSVIWYSTKEEKQEIVDGYKAKLRSIDCKYFDFGNGTCPFGTICFYKHMHKPGVNRSHTYQPTRYRTQRNRSHVYGHHSHRPHDALIEDELLEELASELIAEQELEDVEDIDSLMAFLLMQMDLDVLVSSSDDES